MNTNRDEYPVSRWIVELSPAVVLFIMGLLGFFVIQPKHGSPLVILYAPLSALLAVYVFLILSRRYGRSFKTSVSCVECGHQTSIYKKKCSCCGVDRSSEAKKAFYELGKIIPNIAILVIIIVNLDSLIKTSSEYDCIAYCCFAMDDLERLDKSQISHFHSYGKYYNGLPGPGKPISWPNEDVRIAMINVDQIGYVYAASHARCNYDCSGIPEVYILDSAVKDDCRVCYLKSQPEKSLAAYAAMGDVESFKALYYETAPRLDKIMLHGKSAMELAMINERHEMIKLLEELGFPKGGNMGNAPPAAGQ